MDLREFVIADSGAREEHSTGAVRDIREGKGRFDLITPVALRRLARVYEGGARKYAPRNWEKGMPFSRFTDSAVRHINDYLMIALYKREGIPLEKLPPEVNPNEDHLAQALWNVAALIHMEEIHPELDDLNRKIPETMGEAVAKKVEDTDMHFGYVDRRPEEKQRRIAEDQELRHAMLQAAAEADDRQQYNLAEYYRRAAAKL